MARSSSSEAPRGDVTERRDSAYAANLWRCSSDSGDGFFCCLYVLTRDNTCVQAVSSDHHLKLYSSVV